jgi:hypothetical protein
MKTARIEAHLMQMYQVAEQMQTQRADALLDHIVAALLSQY